MLEVRIRHLLLLVACAHHYNRCTRGVYSPMRSHQPRLWCDHHYVLESETYNVLVENLIVKTMDNI
jgi:hypothetical protein